MPSETTASGTSTVTGVRVIGPYIPWPSTAPEPELLHFEIVSSNLLKLGALTLKDFLCDPYQEPHLEKASFPTRSTTMHPSRCPLFSTTQNGESGNSAQTHSPIFILRQRKKKVSVFEFLNPPPSPPPRYLIVLRSPSFLSLAQRNDASSPSHGLTMHRALSKPEFARKAEARAAAAAVAVGMGTTDFVKHWHGSPEPVAKRRLVLAPLDTPGSVQEPSLGDAGEDLAAAEIREQTDGKVQVCKLSLYPFRIFSVDVAHPSFEAAKAACAADAIVEGILDFIEFENGQTVPAERRLFQP
ncbi:hypothetical protein BC826DRAFT_1190013 [Russula brevipes]|nr:hypothetical protein BC826DRAFT_1190013 [Russula brevipes]